MTKKRACVVCYRPETLTRTVHEKLCASCNKAMRLLKEDPTRLLNMLRYIVLYLNELEDK
jgi:hypothetical protein